MTPTNKQVTTNKQIYEKITDSDILTSPQWLPVKPSMMS